LLKTGAFKDRKAFSFQIGLFFYPCLWSRTLITTERILSQEQAADMGFLRRVVGVTLYGKVHKFEISKARNVKPLLRIERTQLSWVGPGP